ncbi:MAG: hypothetical protein M1838_000940 [Thelocarpon superellum]|nr:MAG: hypothetical protein M1838_000940 [Thelocarpon superellum]
MSDREPVHFDLAEIARTASCIHALLKKARRNIALRTTFDRAVLPKPTKGPSTAYAIPRRPRVYLARVATSWPFDEWEIEYIAFRTSMDRDIGCSAGASSNCAFNFDQFRVASPTCGKGTRTWAVAHQELQRAKQLWGLMQTWRARANSLMSHCLAPWADSPLWEIMNECYLANWEHLLRRYLHALLDLVLRSMVQLYEQLLLDYLRRSEIFGQGWFFEWPDGQRPLTSTWPWSDVKVSVMILYGVCWKFWNRPDAAGVALPFAPAPRTHPGTSPDASAASDTRHTMLAAPQPPPGTTSDAQPPALPVLSGWAGTRETGRGGDTSVERPWEALRQNDEEGERDALHPSLLSDAEIENILSYLPPDFSTSTEPQESDCCTGLTGPTSPYFRYAPTTPHPYLFDPTASFAGPSVPGPASPRAPDAGHPGVAPDSGGMDTEDTEPGANTKSPPSDSMSIARVLGTMTEPVISPRSSSSDAAVLPAPLEPTSPPVTGHRAPPRPRAVRDREAPKNEHGEFYCNHEECAQASPIPTFVRRCEWSKHLDKHERPYRCTEAGCEKLQGFTYSGGLSRHEREVHSKHGGLRVRHMCPHQNCKRSSGAGFTRRENLDEHLRRVHKEVVEVLPRADTKDKEEGMKLPASKEGVALFDDDDQVVGTKRKRRSSEAEPPSQSSCLSDGDSLSEGGTPANERYPRLSHHRLNHHRRLNGGERERQMERKWGREREKEEEEEENETKNLRHELREMHRENREIKRDLRDLRKLVHAVHKIFRAALP